MEGDERLEVEVHCAYGKPHAGSGYWGYSVKPFDDYLFVRIPVNLGRVVEAVDKAEGHTDPDLGVLPDSEVYRIDRTENKC